MHIVLVGASIGQAWDLAGWPARVNAARFTSEAVQAWQFDKSAALDEVLLRPARKPWPVRKYLKSLFQPAPARADVVILKECSSYFPGDLARYELRVGQWVNLVRSRGVRPMLATVVPITRARAQKNIGKQESLVAYNRWIRTYAANQGIPVLDLESALRSEDESAYLRDEFTSGDGSHLNTTAYAVLDRVLLRSLEGILN